MNTKKTFLILLAIIILGTGLRAYKLDANSFVTDEFLDINASYGYYKTGQWLAWDFNTDKVSNNLFAPRDERAWPYRWQVAQLFRWFPPTETVARSISVAWGVISIIAIYFVGKYFTGKKEIGLSASFLFAISALGVSIDRTLRMYAMFMPVFLLFSWFLFRFFEEEYRGKIMIFRKIFDRFEINIAWLLPVAVAGLVSWHTHILTANMGLIVFIYLLINFLRIFLREKRLTINKYAVSLAVLATGFGIFYLLFPKIVSNYSQFFTFFKFNSKYFYAIVSDYTNFILAYFFIFLGIYAISKNSKFLKGTVWISACFFTILGAAIFIWSLGFGLRFIFFAMPFGIILISMGIYHGANFISGNSLKFKQGIFAGFLAASLILLPDYSRFFGSNNFYKQSEGDPDYRKIFAYIVKNGAPGNTLITRNFRSYYFKDAQFNVIPVEWEKSISMEKLNQVISESSVIWTVFGDGKGSFNKEALQFTKSNFQLKKEITGKGIYKWEK